MPYTIKKTEAGYYVINAETGRKMNKKPHRNRKQAVKHLMAVQKATGE